MKQRSDDANMLMLAVLPGGARVNILLYLETFL